MTTDDDLTAGQQQERPGDQNQREHIKQLEKDLARERATAEQHAAAARELAFFKAGVDPDKPGATWFIKGYDGELTAEAIKAEAEKAGFLRTQQQAAPAQPAQTPVGGTAIGHSGVDESAVAAQGFAAIQQATVDPQISGGVNHIEGMREAAEKGFRQYGAKGAVDGITRYFQTHDLPVAEGAQPDTPPPV